MRKLITIFFCFGWVTVDAQLLSEPQINPHRSVEIEEQGLKSATKYKLLETDSGEFIVKQAFEQYNRFGEVDLREMYRGGELQRQERFYVKDTLGHTFRVEETVLANGQVYRRAMTWGITPRGPRRYYKYSGSGELLVAEERDSITIDGHSALREIKFRKHHDTIFRVHKTIDQTKGYTVVVEGKQGEKIDEERIIDGSTYYEVYEEAGDSFRLKKKVVPSNMDFGPDDPNPLVEIFYSAEGGVVTRHEYKSLSSRRKAEHVYSGEFGTTLIIEKKYNRRGRLIKEKAHYKGNDEIEFKRVRRYSWRGKLRREKHWARGGRPKTLEKFRYDRKGNLVQHLKYRYEGKKKIEYIHNLYEYKWFDS